MSEASQAAVILGTGMSCAVGLSAPAAAAAVRAGVAGARRSSIHDRRYEPFTLAILDDDALPPLAAELDARVGITMRQARMLRLAGPALREALETLPETAAAPPLLLATPEPLPERPPPVGEDFIEQIALQAEVSIDPEHSTLFPTGRAGGLAALAAGLRGLAAGRYEQVLVGGVDSCLDLGLLAHLDSQDRILARGVMDGFIPGEGAAFLLLGNDEAGTADSIRVLAVGESEEPGHLYSEEPYRGDGLAQAFAQLFDTVPPDPPAATVFAGLNGESFGAKEWGVASLRHAEHIADGVQIEHPADCLGDTGAALGPQMLVLATIGLGRGYIPGPCLVWCSSDLAPRAATLLSLSQPGA